MMHTVKQFRAFTLIELLVVVSMIVLLIALLLPSLQNARYQARVAVCASTLRTLSQAVTSYAVDYRLRYPTPHEPPPADQPSWHRTDFKRPWAWSEHNPAHRYDMRPLYREYLGGPLNETAKCPLANSTIQAGNLDGSRVSSYAMFMTNNHKSKHFYFEHDGQGIISSKMGRPWSPQGHPEYEFTYVASDVAFGRGFNGPMIGHPAMGGSSEYNGPINSHSGYQIGPFMLNPNIPLNFLDGDGSVRTFLVHSESYRDQDQWLVNGNYLIPKALAR